MHHTVSNILNGKCCFKHFNVDLNLSFFLFFLLLLLEDPTGKTSLHDVLIKLWGICTS